MENSNVCIGENFGAYNGDCVELLRDMPPDSVHLSLFSPPYLSLYVYSASPRDIGNCRSDEEFWGHFGFVIDELMRVTKPGRIVAVDCMNVPAMKERDGYIGLKDFRGDLIREHVKRGFIFHSEHCMWKDPLIEATRTKALGLMHKQLCKDSAMSRAGIPQYLLAFRKPGKNPEPIAHEKGLEYFVGEDPPAHGNLSHERWRRYASPVWMDIDFTETLNYRAAREKDDERHVCPMALDIIRRAVHLWSNPGDTVMSPFMGIGSEGVVALENGRRFVGFELKRSYYDQACANLREASEETSTQLQMFGANSNVATPVASSEEPPAPPPTPAAPLCLLCDKTKGGEKIHVDAGFFKGVVHAKCFDKLEQHLAGLPPDQRTAAEAKITSRLAEPRP